MSGADKTKSYWAIVGGQLRRNRVAMFGYRCILLLVLIAVYTPILASDRPFYFSGPDGLSFPWLTDLFDLNEVRQPVDLFFNLVMVLSIPLGAIYLIARRVLRRRGDWNSRIARRFLFGFAIVFLWLLPGLMLSDATVQKPFFKVVLAPGLALRSSKPVVDYHDRLDELHAEGKDASAAFPILPYHYNKTRVREGSLQPDWFLGPTEKRIGAVGKHPLGTDNGGKDVMTTLLYGTRISMTIGVLAVSIYVTIGIILGSLAGYFGGWVDILISRLVEVFICLPGLFFILTIIAVFEQRSIFLIMFAIGILGWTGVARLVRGEFLTQRGQDYVIAAQSQGIYQRRIIFRHVLPNSLTPVLVAATFGVAAAILTESSIAFLGLGDPAAASWGVLLDKGRNTQYEWLILPPGVAIFFTVTSFNMLGEGLRDALDPKLRH